MQAIELFTIGHSNHSPEDFLELLRQHEIAALVDIRRFPGSRAFPHFNQEELAPSLRQHHIDYHWLQALGGRQPRRRDFESPNTTDSSATTAEDGRVIRSPRRRWPPS